MAVKSGGFIGSFPSASTGGSSSSYAPSTSVEEELRKAIQSNQTIGVGNTFYNTAALSQSDLNNIINQAKTQGYQTFTQQGTGDNTKLGTIYNSNGQSESRMNPYTWGEQNNAYATMGKQGASDYLTGLYKQIYPNAPANGQMNQPQQAPQQTQYTQSGNMNTLNNGYTTGNNNSMINQMYAEVVNQLKQKIAQIKSGYENIKTQVPQQYQPLKNQSELDRAKGLDTLKEVIANRGDSGGIGRQEMLIADSQAANRLAQINLQQQNEINALNQKIQENEATGNIEEANINIDKLKALIADNNATQARYDELTKFGYQQEQDRIRNNVTAENLRMAIEEANKRQQQQSWENTFKQNQFDYQKQQDELENKYRYDALDKKGGLGGGSSYKPGSTQAKQANWNALDMIIESPKGGLGAAYSYLNSNRDTLIEEVGVQEYQKMYLDTLGKISQQNYRQNRGGYVDYENPNYSYGE